jgi:hypothetical protein
MSNLGDRRIKNDYLLDKRLKAYAKRKGFTYFGCIALFGDDKVYEVYRERNAGHFILIDRRNRKATPFHPDGLEDVRYRTGAQCTECKAIIYSSHKRHLQKCRCHNLMIDGGQEMLRISCEKDDSYIIVTVDMLGRRIV